MFIYHYRAGIKNITNQHQTLAVFCPTVLCTADIFLTAEKEPSINLGGVLPSINSNYRVGAGPYFIAESCEYFDSFLKFHPYIGVILNIESDHLDYFKDLSHIETSFRGFAQNIEQSGALIINHDTLHLEELTAGLVCRVVTFGAEQADYHAANVAYDEEGFASFDVLFKGEKLTRLSLKMCGAHNIMNALAALAVAREAGIDVAVIKTALEKFQSTKRRYEWKGQVRGVSIYDDYAHHPTEIEATLSAAKNSRHNKLYCVFQPHTYTRTKLLKEAITQSFDKADCVVLVDIYAAREVDAGDIHARDLLDGIRSRGIEAYYCESFAEAETLLAKKCIQGDLLITMGAGDVHLIGETLLHTGLSTLSTAP